MAGAFDRVNYVANYDPALGLLQQAQSTMNWAGQLAEMYAWDLTDVLQTLIHDFALLFKQITGIDLEYNVQQFAEGVANTFIYYLSGGTVATGDLEDLALIVTNIPTWDLLTLALIGTVEVFHDKGGFYAVIGDLLEYLGGPVNLGGGAYTLRPLSNIPLPGPVIREFEDIALEIWGEVGHTMAEVKVALANAAKNWTDLLFGLAKETVADLVGPLNDILAFDFDHIPISVITGLQDIVQNFTEAGVYVGELALSQITGLGTGMMTWLANAPSMAVTAITGLGTGMMTWLQSAPSLAITSITGLGTGMATWLQSAPSMAVTAITGLGTGMATWLQSAPAMAVGSVTGMATGINSWLSAGGALPSATRLATTQISDWATAIATALGNIPSSLISAGTLTTAAISNWATAIATALGNIPSTLISAGTLAGSAITGALNSAVSVLGTQVSGVGDSILDDVNDMLDAVSASTAAAFGDFVSTASTNATNAVDQITDAVEQVLDDAGTAVTTFGQSLQSAFASWLGGWIGGTPPAAASAPDVADAIAAQRDTIVGISTAVAQLQAAAQASGSSGVFGGDDFERTDTDDLGTDWSLTYSGGDSSDGYLAITNGHQAAWEPGDLVTRSVLARRIATADQHTQTNYQKVVWTVGSGFGVAAYPNKLWVRLYGRLTDDESKYVFAEIRRYPSSGIGPWIYTVQFGYKNTGSEILIGTETTITSVSPGDNFAAYFGVPETDENYHSLTKNGTEVKAWDDSSSPVAASGTSNLGWGCGMQAAADVLGAQGLPASLDSITIADNSPAPGDYASLPAAGNAGRIYICGDVGRWEKDNGTDWDTILVNDEPTELFGDVPSTGWTAVNMTTGSTWAKDLDGQLLTIKNNGAGHNWMYQYRAYPGSAFDLIVRLDWQFLGPYGMPQGNGQAAYGALVISDGTKLLTFGPYCYNGAQSAPMYSLGTGIHAAAWSNASTYAASKIGTWFVPVYWLPQLPKWYRFTDDGTYRILRYSFNGVDWSTVLTEARTTYFTPTRIGIAGNNFGDASAALRVRSWKGVA